MHIDIDEFLKIDFFSEPGRIFPYELFVSHRRLDTPHDLFQKLQKANVKYVWDYDLDLRDRRVIHQVSRSISNSRYVGLYISENYVDSPWCAAEYLSALSAEKYFKIERVLLILESAKSI